MGQVERPGETGPSGGGERFGQEQERLTGAAGDDDDDDAVGVAAVLAAFAGDVGELELPRDQRAADELGEPGDQCAVSRASRGPRGVPCG